MTHGIPLGAGDEFDLVRSLIARFGDAADGIGDDAGAVHVPPGETMLVSTDVAVEDVHFRRAWLTPREIGYRATTAALSDLAAMAATPRAIVVALTLPRRWRSDAPEIADGIAEAAVACGALIIGGDVSGGTALSIAVTVMGSTARPLSRAGATPGDAIWVTGRLGGPASALRALQAGAATDASARERFAHPVARVREAIWLAAHGATAGIDISDGLASDLGHIAAASGVRISLDLDRVPVLTGTPEAAAASGEEYELAIAAPASLDAAAFAREFGIPLTMVGRVERGDGGAMTDEGVSAKSGAKSGAKTGVVAMRAGAPVPLPRGFDHFAG